MKTDERCMGIVKHAKHDLRQAEPGTTILQLEYDGRSVLQDKGRS